MRACIHMYAYTFNRRIDTRVRPKTQGRIFEQLNERNAFKALCLLFGINFYTDFQAVPKKIFEHKYIQSTQFSINFTVR